MIKIKDLPFKSTLTIFEEKIDNEKMNLKIIKEIDKSGDRQNYNTNVKAQMTDWNMENKPGFKELKEIILNMSIQASLEKYKTNIKPEILNMWGMKYKSGEQALMHDHWPSLWSCAYYINPPENSPGLLFPEADVMRKVEHGLLIMFEGFVKHSVVPTNFEGYRYVVSANIKGDRLL
jgi:hypothetical protein